MKNNTEKLPGERRLRIKSAPRIRQVFWCDYPNPEHTQKPEFYKTRPVVVLSRNSTLHGVVIVVPLSGKQQTDERNTLKIRSPIDGDDCWVVCNHVHTVSTRRLNPPSQVIPKVTEDDFEEIKEKVCNNLPLRPYDEEKDK
ncbi:MAG: type II toxin-antitoxin system PemK/MazF family toxin [Rhodobacteraceae bacterium]|nr:type II toxin-antitoxin system PemK/MazF family toxin [Paracoccaceae bacterium]